VLGAEGECAICRGYTRPVRHLLLDGYARRDLGEVNVLRSKEWLQTASVQQSKRRFKKFSM